MPTCICQELYGRLTLDGESIDMATPHGLAQFIMHQVISMQPASEPVRFQAIQAIVAPLHRLEVLAQRSVTKEQMRRFVRAREHTRPLDPTQASQNVGLPSEGGALPSPKDRW